jgi:hypothetical protein
MTLQNSPILEITLKPWISFKAEGLESGGTRAFDVGFHIVDEQAFLRPAAGLGDRLVINPAVRFGASGLIGQNQIVEIAQRGIVGASVPVMNFIGIGQRDQPVMRTETLEQAFRK